MSENNIQERLAELTKPYPLSNFSPRYVGSNALEQMILGHQLKYIENLIQAEEENKLAEENSRDLSAYAPEIQAAAFEHAEKAMYDPDYFVRNKIDTDLIKPIQIVGVIKAKREEAKQKTWKVDYHARLINRLREFKLSARRIEKQDSLLKRFIFWK